MGHSTEAIFVDKRSVGQNVTKAGILNRAADIYRSEEYGDPSIGWATFQMPSTVMTRAEADRLVFHAQSGQWRVDSDNGVIIPVVVDDAKVLSVTKKFKQLIPAEQVKKIRESEGDYSVLIPFVSKQAEGFVSSVRVVSLPKPLKPQAVSTVGRTVTVYKVVVCVSSRWDKRQIEDKEEYQSLADARQAALAIAEARIASGKAYDRIEVRPVTRRDTGEQAMVVIESSDRNGVAEFEYTVSTVRKNADIDGWMVYFDVHH